MHTRKKTPVKKALELSKQLNEVKKMIQRESGKQHDLHMIRIFFKKLKAYVSLTNALSGQELKLPHKLRDYYKVTGVFRDAKIFKKLCNKYFPTQTFLENYYEEKIDKAKEDYSEFFNQHKGSTLYKDLNAVVVKQDAMLDALEVKWIKAGLETFLYHEEQLIKQLLQSPMITDVSIHEIRKKIKMMLYLLKHVCPTQQATWKHKVKAYKKFSKRLGVWNDLNSLVKKLEGLPRMGEEPEKLDDIIHQEASVREKILKKLRKEFAVHTTAISETTKRVNLKDATSAGKPKKNDKDTPKSEKKSGKKS